MLFIVSQTQSYSYEENDDLSCISLAKSEFTNSNRASFSSFTNSEDYNGFNKQINVFRGDVTGVTYIGLVVDYNTLALEYVFSRNLGHDALNAGLQFKCDWRTEF